MYIAQIEHIATGITKQIEISFIDYLLWLAFPNYMMDGLEKQLDIVFDYEYFYNGVKYV